MQIDRNFKPLSVSDGFKKARRNALVWSSITIVAYFGTDPADKSKHISNISTTIGQIGLLYSWKLIVIFCYFASLFMFVGFLREQTILKTHNSEALFEKQILEVGDFIGRVSTEVRDLSISVEGYNNSLRSAVNQIENEINISGEISLTMHHNLKGAFLPLYERNFNIDYCSLKEKLQDSGFTNLENIVGMEIYNSFQNFQNEFFVSIDQTLDEFNKNMQSRSYVMSNIFSDNKLGMANIEQKIESLSRVESALKIFSNSISANELRWLRFYDIYPVYILFSISTLSVLSTYFFPSMKHFFI
ncbi:hypothetical protein [Novosphingobium sp.]|uniref:hypothetical protein n=1 Tax=Novosphingobium sp. TaxID=1874826 RepID=UPI0035B185E3